MSKRLSKQQIKKRIDKKCFFCEEDDYNLLDVHRILDGAKGGNYNNRNTLTVCSKCHRKIHSGRIKIFGKYLSTSANWVVHYEEDEEERWK